jgi:hypothetical protein
VGQPVRVWGRGDHGVLDGGHCGHRHAVGFREVDRFGTTWEPDCFWADGSAVVHVFQTVDFEKPSAEFDLEAFAAKTAIIRNEVRVVLAP